MTASRIGVLGGTFDPVHHGHLLLALYAREQLACDRVVLIPNSHSPFKTERPQASFDNRLAMLRLAIHAVTGLDASDIEGRRGGVSFMVDTLSELRRSMPDTAIRLILGADAYRDLPEWHESARIREVAQVAVVARGNDQPALIDASDVVVRMPRFDISASEIRARIRDGQPIDYLTPATVVTYIHEHRLYRAR